MSTSSSDATSTTTKRIVMASALLLGGQGCVGAASANPAFVSRPNHHHHHRTPWGVSPPLSSSSDHTVALDSLLSKIPRGGANEATPDEPKANNSSSRKKSKEPKKKKNRKDKEKDNHNKKQNKRDKKKESKAETGGATSKDNEEEPQSQSPPSNPMVDEILNSEDYYDILGLSRGEDNAGRIKKAYRRRAVQTHPDKTGGDRRAFDKLAEAYDVLLDDEKRALYDRYGKAGLDPTAQHRHGGGGGPEDLFRSFFGAGPQQRQQPQGPINRTLRYQYTVTLEELYQGVSHKVTVEAPPERFGFYQQQQAAPARKKQVEVTVPRGAHAGQNIRLSGEMDFYSQEAPPGDLVFSLQLRPHKIFTRKGHDLAMTATISLAEAIGGCTRVIRHLDGRIITIESAKLERPVTDDDDNVVDNSNDNNSHEGPTLDDLENNNHGKTPSSSSESVNVYIQTGDVQVLKGQGMPKDAQGTEFGDLYVQYEVELPKGQASLENLTPSERLELARLLEKLEGKAATASSNNKPSRKGKKKEASYTLAPAKLSDFGHASGVPNFDDDEEEDDHHHHQQQQFPFHGMGHRQFFYSSTGRSPFFGQETNFEDDENVQCRQM